MLFTTVLTFLGGEAQLQTPGAFIGVIALAKSQSALAKMNNGNNKFTFMDVNKYSGLPWSVRYVC